MSVKIASSAAPLESVVADLAKQLGMGDFSIVIYFASPRYTPELLAPEMEARFPGAIVVGCTTAGEMIAGEALEHSVVAMAIPHQLVPEASMALVTDVSPATGDIAAALASLERQLGRPIRDLDIGQYVGMVLFDGLSGAEERIMERLGDRADIPFVGGSAADEMVLHRTCLYAQGRTWERAALLLILHVPRGYQILKTQSFHVTPEILHADAVDLPSRQVFRFNGRPAMEAYARALHCSPQGARACFASHPLGLVIDGDPFVREIRGTDGNAIRFYCQIRSDAELHVLEPTNIVQNTYKLLAAQVPDPAAVAALIQFQCHARASRLKQDNELQTYTQLFRGLPMLGFNTYGEQYLGHMNQTSTMLLLQK